MTRLVADLKSTTVEAQIAVFDWEDLVNSERKMVANLRFLLRNRCQGSDGRFRQSDTHTLKSLLLSVCDKVRCRGKLNLKRGPMRNGHAKWLVTTKRFGMKVALVGA